MVDSPALADPGLAVLSDVRKSAKMARIVRFAHLCLTPVRIPVIRHIVR